MMYLVFVVSTIFCYLALADDGDCPQLLCDPRTMACPYPTYYALVPSRVICRGCNVCVKTGSPVDSKGCPQLPCRDIQRGQCRKPWLRNSWIVYNGKQCETCEALLCNL